MRISAPFRIIAQRFFALISLAGLFLGNVSSVSAGLFGGGPSIPSTSEVLSEMERRYHLDTESIQNQGENFNVADAKKPSPEVSLFFSPSDPKPGEKISAHAFPVYFASNENEMYYTWYLKRKECNLTKSPDAATKSLCDHNGDGWITVEDWKIEAASIIAENGFDFAGANYGSDTDDDGYKARFGGDNKIGMPNHCYISDNTNGKFYELGTANGSSFDCPPGSSPVCLVSELSVTPSAPSVSTSTGSASCTISDGSGSCGTSTSVSSTNSPDYDFSDSGRCFLSGYPYCDSQGFFQGLGMPGCSVGTPRCLANVTNSTECGTPLLRCSPGGGITSDCLHLFPKAPGFTSGDGVFGADEERFWGTDPHDPDTANNGNKDEANVVGLGRALFTWNYQSGDQVGVAVEGVSMISTKYNDSSSMIMWAFPNKDCPLSLASATATTTKNIKGYAVAMPVADIDLNVCIPRNLVDPTQGGQPTNLDVSITTTPDNPINDESFDETGDLLVAQASISNPSRSQVNTLYDWKVEMSNNIQFRNGPGLLSANITNDLRSAGLLQNVNGISLDTLRLKLNLKKRNTSNQFSLWAGHRLEEYLVNGVGYLRFSTTASESFESGSTRKGKSDVIVKFISTGLKINAYKVDTVLIGAGPNALRRVKLPNALASGIICDADPLDRSACRVIKNEIIGLWVDPTGLKNFQWTINGKPFTCTQAAMSPSCEKDGTGANKPGEQWNINFFPVSGDVGDTYTVTVTGTDVTSDKTTTLSRTFHVVSPQLLIESSATDTAWAKFIGQYKDLTGTESTACPGGMCNEFSKSIFEGFSGSDFNFKGTFVPGFLKDRSVRQWTVDGVYQDESAPGEISFHASKNPQSVYNIGLTASVTQPEEIRQALRDIWGISQLDSTEVRFSSAVQVELKENGEVRGNSLIPGQYLAAIASYIPTSVMFTLRIALSIALILFTARVLFELLPDYADSSRRHR